MDFAAAETWTACSAKLFIAGKLSCGDYFDHLLSWYEHRNDPNVLFFTYEEMKKDTVLWTLKIANFMGEQYGMKLREDPDLLRKVIDASSLKNMQGKIIGHDDEPLHKSEGFIRKGIVGDWKAHFTNEQIQDMKTWIAEKTKGSDVMSLWKHLDLP
ncbi:hypothetical protein MRX96_001931 [Rhipicephalus microplus]